MHGAKIEGKDGFVLLGRRENGFLEVLALDVEDGKVLCLFETQELADAFAKVSPAVRGQGWRVHVMNTDTLPRLVEKFDYVTLNPSPQLSSRQELITVLGFTRSLKREGTLGID